MASNNTIHTMNLASQDQQSSLHKHHDFYFVLAVFSLFFAGDLMWNQVQEVNRAQDYASGTISLTLPNSENRDAARLNRDIAKFEQESALEADSISAEFDAEDAAVDVPLE